jgi:hypothetical protein
MFLGQQGRAKIAFYSSWSTEERTGRFSRWLDSYITVLMWGSIDEMNWHCKDSYRETGTRSRMMSEFALTSR